MALTDTNALCKLDDLKADLGISGATYDTALERRILAASQMIEAYCGRKFRQGTRAEKLPGYGTSRLLPSVLPIVSVTSVVFDDGSAIDAANYSVETDSNGDGWALYAPFGWQWTAAGLQGIDRQPIPLVGSERRAFTVTYVGGYGLPNDTTPPSPTLPTIISEACIMLAGTLWRRRGRDANVMAESVGDASVQFGYLGGVDSAPGERFGIPHEIAAMLDGYRRAV